MVTDSAETKPGVEVYPGRISTLYRDQPTTMISNVSDYDRIYSI